MARFLERSRGLVAVSLLQLAALGACQGPSHSRSTDVDTRTGALNQTAINVALQANGGVASASSCFGGNCSTSAYPVAAVNNGDRKGNQNGTSWGNGGGWNDNTSGAFPDWVQIAFAGAKTISEIDVFTLQDNLTTPSDPTLTMTFSQYGITQFDVQYWNGSSWVTVPSGSVTGNSNVWKQFSFAPITTQKIQVNVTNAMAGYSRIVEIEAYTPPLTFTSNDLGYWGAVAIGDFNGDGCAEVLGSQNDCRGNLLRRPESAIGVGDLRAVNAMGQARAYRDVRAADFNGDGIADLIANAYDDDSVYHPDADAGVLVHDPASKILIFFGNGDGTFTEVAHIDAPFLPTPPNNYEAFYGETIVIADFDNDSDLDVFLPHYTHDDARRHNYLLINNGSGSFTDVAASAGVATNYDRDHRPEGAQAIDINQDGWLDIYTGSHLWVNNHNLTFTDQAPGYDLPHGSQGSCQSSPCFFDEGAKFYDWNNDGNVDLLLLPAFGSDPAIYQSNGSTYSAISNPFDVLPSMDRDGANVEDVDGDGFMDVIIGGGGAWPTESTFQNPTLFLYRQGHYIVSDLLSGTAGWSDLLAFADFDLNGTMDPLLRAGPPPAWPLSGGQDPDEYEHRGNFQYLKNNNVPASAPIKVLMLDANGHQTQQGRRVKAVAQDGSNFTMTRYVDGGSGYMSNNEYTITFPTPRGNSYQISAAYDSGTVQGTATAGSTVNIYKDGRFIIDASGFNGPRQNLALGKAVTFSSEISNSGWTAARAVNGNRNSFAGAPTVGDHGWSSNSNLGVQNHTEWITVDLGASRNVASVDLWPRNDLPNVGVCFPIDFTIKVSPDNATWTTVITRTAYSQPSFVKQFVFPATAARYVRIEGTKLGFDGTFYRMQLAEIEVYENLALGKTVTKTSEEPGWPATAIVDGNKSSPPTWSSSGYADPNHTESITVDLGSVNPITRFDLYPRNDSGNVGLGFPVNFTIQTSPTGVSGSWTTVVTRTNYAQPADEVQKFPVAATGRFVKVEATVLRAAGLYRFQLAELEVY